MKRCGHVAHPQNKILETLATVATTGSYKTRNGTEPIRARVDFKISFFSFLSDKIQFFVFCVVILLMFYSK